MKNKIKFFGLIALVMLSASPLTLIAQSGGRRTEDFFKVFNSGSYHMKANVWTGTTQTAVYEIYAKDGKLANTTVSQGVTTRIINKDKKTYMVVDSEKTVMVLPMQEQAQTGTETDGMVYGSSGTANFRGKNLPYEEYSDSRARNMRLQYFFDGNKLAGIRSIESGSTTDIEVIALDQSIPGNAFDIPNGYEVTDMSGFGSGLGGFGR